jgi:hypothetical protein
MSPQNHLESNRLHLARKVDALATAFAADPPPPVAASYFAVQAVPCYDTEADCARGADPTALLPAGSAMVADAAQLDPRGRAIVRLELENERVWACTQADDGSDVLVLLPTGGPLQAGFDEGILSSCRPISLLYGESL